MINRRNCLVASLLLTLTLCGRGAHGQVPVTISQGTYTNPGTPQAAAEIASFCSANAGALFNEGDPQAMANSRANLSAAPSPAGTAAAPAFQLAYASGLNNALAAQLAPAKKPTLRQRLNAAIVVAKVATQANNAALQQVTIMLINDPAEPVLMWALKAAQPQVPHVLGAKIGNAAPPLVAAIVPAVLRHPSGPVFDEAYKALNVVDVSTKDELLKLWGNRLVQYKQKDAKEAPDDPDVDGKPIFTLTTATMWTSVLNNPKAQSDVMQLVSDQLSLASQWADVTPPGEKRDGLIGLIAQAAGGVYVVGGHQKQQGLVAATAAAINLNPKQFPANAKTAPIVQPIIQAIAAAYPAVAPPPKIAVGAGAGAAAGVAAQPAAAGK